MDAVVKRVRRGERRIRYRDILEDLENEGHSVGSAVQEPPLTEDIAVRSLINVDFSEEEVVKVARKLKDDGVTLSAEGIFNELTRISISEGTGSTSEAAVKEGGDDDIDGLVEGNRDLRNQMLCKICLDREVKIVFLPCGHLVACQICASAMRECPVCRGHIRACVIANFAPMNSPGAEGGAAASQ